MNRVAIHRQLLRADFFSFRIFVVLYASLFFNSVQHLHVFAGLNLECNGQPCPTTPHNGKECDGNHCPTPPPNLNECNGEGCSYTSSTTTESSGTTFWVPPEGFEGNIEEYNEETYRVVVQDVLDNTDKEIVPKVNFSEPLELRIFFDMLSLAQFDELSGEISLVASLTLQWSAETTPRWNPKYMLGGKESVTISAADVWRPQLFLLNPSKKVQDLTSNLNRLRLGYDGSVEWNIVTILEASCNIDVTYFPFDTQTCSIFIAPWGYDNTELNIAGLQTTTHDYLSQDHSSWGLADLETNGNNNEKTSYLNVTVRFKRHYEFFLINVLLPPILLSVINPCVFLLPAASGERMSFSVTCFLAFSVFMTLLGDNMPKSATPISHLSFFLMFMLVHSCFISLVTILSLKIYHKDGISPVPHWLQVFVKLVRFRYCRGDKCKGDLCRRKTHTTPEKDGDPENIELEYINEKKIQPEFAYQPPDVITWYLVGKTFDYFFFCLFLGWMMFAIITALMAISLI